MSPILCITDSMSIVTLNLRLSVLRASRALVNAPAVMHAVPVSEHVETGPRQIRLRYPAACATCGLELSPGSQALWDRAAKAATCLACAPSQSDPQPEPDTAGASAAAEGQRRKEKRVEDARRRYGDHAAAVAEAMAE